MKERKKINVGLIQMKSGDDPAENLARCLARVEEAAEQGAHIISTQELFRTSYFCQVPQHDNFSLAEPIPGPTTEALASIAKERGVVIIASLFEERSAGLFHNTAIVIDADGTLLGKYRKMHIFDHAHSYEAFYFTPGDLGFKSFDTQHGSLGILLGWDQWFPEAARITALNGADILFTPTAIGWDPAQKEQHGAKQHSAWETILRSHAIANGIYVVAINRVGYEPLPKINYAPAMRTGDGIEFWGQSFVADPMGRMLAKASATDEQVLITEINFQKTVIQRTHWPYLRDRRIDAYGDIDKRVID